MFRIPVCLLIALLRITNATFSVDECSITCRGNSAPGLDRQQGPPGKRGPPGLQGPVGQKGFPGPQGKDLSPSLEMAPDLLDWIVIQRRMDGSEDFYRGWDDYVNGFGSATGEFWLGLDKISKLMSLGKFQLWIDLLDFEGNWRHAQYSTFSVGSSQDNFTATSSGYSGNAGDSLSLNNVQFTTKDRDHDTSGENCSKRFKGGWWYSNCHSANLNGLYLNGEHESYADGVNWFAFKGYKYSLKFSQMKLRITQ